MQRARWRACGGEGFFYVATGERYRAEAAASAWSLRAHMPEAHITLFADQPVDGPFDETELLSTPTFSFADKVTVFPRVRYEKAVFLDTDTYIADEISDLFAMLDHVDFAAAVEVARGYWYHEWDLPDCFPEFNTGVVAFRRTPAVHCMLNAWGRYFEESRDWQEHYEATRGNPWDQPPLRKALYESRAVRIAALPSEYNALRHNGTYLWGRAKIVHGRGNIATVAERMNRHPNLERAYFQGLGAVAAFDRLPWRSMIEIVLRANALAMREVVHRARRACAGTAWRTKNPAPSRRADSATDEG